MDITAGDTAGHSTDSGQPCAREGNQTRSDQVPPLKTLEPDGLKPGDLN